MRVALALLTLNLLLLQQSKAFQWEMESNEEADLDFSI